MKDIDEEKITTALAVVVFILINFMALRLIWEVYR